MPLISSRYRPSFFLPFSPPPFEPKITFQSPTRVRRLPISRMALPKEESGEKNLKLVLEKKKKRPLVLKSQNASKDARGVYFFHMI